MLTTMPLSPGDIVVLGSDGLWDNVGEEELVEEVGRDVVEGEGGWGHTRITAPSLIV
jgi:protein phosphatase PTC7